MGMERALRDKLCGTCVLAELAALLQEAPWCVSVGECQYVATGLIFIEVNIFCILYDNTCYQWPRVVITATADV